MCEKSGNLDYDYGIGVLNNRIMFLSTVKTSRKGTAAVSSFTKFKTNLPVSQEVSVGRSAHLLIAQ
jgi:hypothetical protein